MIAVSKTNEYGLTKGKEYEVIEESCGHLKVCLDNGNIAYRSCDLMEKKCNNSFWCCDQIEELITEYKERLGRTISEEAYIVYNTVIKELEEILYG